MLTFMLSDIVADQAVQVSPDNYLNQIEKDVKESEDFEPNSSNFDDYRNVFTPSVILDDQIKELSYLKEHFDDYLIEELGFTGWTIDNFDFVITELKKRLSIINGEALAEESGSIETEVEAEIESETEAKPTEENPTARDSKREPTDFLM